MRSPVSVNMASWFVYGLLAVSSASGVLADVVSPEKRAAAPAPAAAAVTPAPLNDLFPRRPAHTPRTTRNHSTRVHSHIVKVTRKTKTTKTTSSSSSKPTSSSTQSSTLTSSSTTAPPTTTPTAPATCEYTGCYGSVNAFPNFVLVDTTRFNTIEFCTKECLASGYPIAGLHKQQCLCATSLNSEEFEIDGSYCKEKCPGDKNEMCGGPDIHGKHVKNGDTPKTRVFDVYSCATATPSSTSSAPTGNPSDDPNLHFRERSVEEPKEPALPRDSRDFHKVRRGGVVRGVEKAQPGNVLVKKDFGVKTPFGS